MYSTSKSNIEKYKVELESGKEHFFNLDLWLQKEYKGDLFWATNYKHLEYLKEYVQSKIRIRGHGYVDHYWNTTMVAKLPQFIKSG